MGQGQAASGLLFSPQVAVDAAVIDLFCVDLLDFIMFYLDNFLALSSSHFSNRAPIFYWSFRFAASFSTIR